MTAVPPAIRPFFPLARVALWIVVFLVAFNLLALALERASLMGWLPDRQTGVGFIVESKQRVDAADAAYRSGAARDGKYLGAIVGISNVREGVSIATLTQALSPRWRFVGVAGAGAGTPSTAEQADLVLKSDLRPDLVVVGISPIHLLDALVDPVRSRAIASKSPPQSALGQVKDAVRQGVWIVNRRTDLRTWVDRQLMDARSAVQSVLGLDAGSQDSRSPWRPMLRTLKEAKPSNQTIENGLAWARSFHADDPAAFAGSTLGPRVGAKMIRDFFGRGACVVVVMMPEHSRLRALQPPAVGRVLADRLRAESGIANLDVLDLRDAVADAQFNDMVHLNTAGSEALSLRLAQALGRLAVAGPPLMASSDAPARQGTCSPVPSD